LNIYFTLLGVYVYGLYDRVNLDDQSKSKSILQLASDVPFGRGEETVLLPDATIFIKVGFSLFPTVQTRVHINLSTTTQKQQLSFQ